MEGDRHRAGMVAAHDLVRHHPAIHHVNDIRLKLSDSSADLISEPIIHQGAFFPSIDKQNAHLQAYGTQALDLFFHENTPAGERRRRVHICDSQDSHRAGLETSHRAAPPPAQWMTASASSTSELRRLPSLSSLLPLSANASP